MYGLIGSFKAAPDKRSELVAILVADSGAMPGCKSYIVAEDPSDSLTVWVTEVWDNQASHKASLQLPTVKAAIAKAMPIIAAFGEQRETNVVGGFGLQE
jgi:quinol monooxygenase YgiN